MPTELLEAIDMAADLALAENEPVLIAEWGWRHRSLGGGRSRLRGIVIERQC
jgi:hypothetical protein